ncbi:MAG: DUF177 domain-containing protein [Candidatus Dadabacteria bacterium]|nr:DUF177 domain-containing protein [Candidatus Dadabacteria bacterium]MDE0519677.1 DUF177 domain-containing protein [Candidatus Dadabacteria bacterium]MDE0662838.1 DUF177 domain-containing protein [Candidatus Dadabacteria bacterium]
MRVNVSEIKDGGLSLNLTRGPGWLGGSEKSEVASVGSDIEFHIDLLRTAGEISVRGKIGFLAVARCSRCLSDVSVDTNLEVNLILSPSETEKKEEAGGEIDYETYRGRTIDLNDYMREQVNLSLPYKVVCVENCRGLCSGCGQNLNEQQCGCETRQEDSRFAVLKDIKI